MSVLLSSIINCFISITYNRDHALQVGSFRDVEQDRMVFGLAANLDEAEGSAGVAGGIR